METPRNAAALFLNEGRRTARFGVRNPPRLSDRSKSEPGIAGDDTAIDAMPFFGVAEKGKCFKSKLLRSFDEHKFSTKAKF